MFIPVWHKYIMPVPCLFQCVHSCTRACKKPCLFPTVTLISCLPLDLVPVLSRVLKLNHRHRQNKTACFPSKASWGRFRVDDLLQLCAARFCNIQLGPSYPLRLSHHIVQSERWGHKAVEISLWTRAKCILLAFWLHHRFFFYMAYFFMRNFKSDYSSFFWLNSCVQRKLLLS